MDHYLAARGLPFLAQCRVRQPQACVGFAEPRPRLVDAATAFAGTAVRAPGVPRFLQFRCVDVGKFTAQTAGAALAPGSASAFREILCEGDWMQETMTARSLCMTANAGRVRSFLSP
jgi:hypothetical protein